jgi:hypothetical protein
MNTEFGGQSLPPFGPRLPVPSSTTLPRTPRESRGLGSRLRSLVHPRTS